VKLTCSAFATEKQPSLPMSKLVVPIWAPAASLKCEYTSDASDTVEKTLKSATTLELKSILVDCVNDRTTARDSISDWALKGGYLDIPSSYDGVVASSGGGVIAVSDDGAVAFMNDEW
jgi:hypothetical protein